MTEHELEEILTFHWPRVLRQAMVDGSDEWVKGFAKSIQRQGRRPNWRPSRKQEQIMRQLVSELGIAQETSFDVIET